MKCLSRICLSGLLFLFIAGMPVMAMESTDEISSPFSQKPKGVSALAWLQQLEGERDKVDLNPQLSLSVKSLSVETLSKEISATLAGKYGFAQRLATPDERQLMLSSLLKTRDRFAGKPDIIHDFYFHYDQEGCWRRVETDPTFAQHMAVIAAADALRWGVIVDRPLFDRDGKVNSHQRAQDVFHETLNKQRQQPSVMRDFVDAIETIAIGIHADENNIKIKKLLAAVSQKNWKRLSDEVGEIGDIIAPQINFIDVLACDFSSFESKGWEAQKIGQFSTWLRENDASLAADKKVFIDTVYKNPKRFGNYVRALLQPMTTRAVLLTTDNQQHFQGMPSDVSFDGTTIALEYRLFAPLLINQSRAVILSPLSFYLTRKLSDHSLKPLLNIEEPNTIQKKSENFQKNVLLLHRLYFGELYPQKLNQLEQRLTWSAASTCGLLVAINNVGVFAEEENASAVSQEYSETPRGKPRGISLLQVNLPYVLHIVKELAQNIRRATSTG